MTVKVIPLENVAQIYSGSGLKGGQQAFGQGGCPWVKVEDLNNAEIRSTSRSLSADGMRQARVSPVHTVFFSSTGTIGKVGIAQIPMAPSNNMIALEFDETKVAPLYGMYCLLAMQEALKAEAGGAVYASLRLSVLKKFKIPVPDLNVQNLIARKLTSLRESELQQKELTEKLKQAAHLLFDDCFGEAVESAVHRQKYLKLGECGDITLNGAAKKGQAQKKATRYVATSQLDDWEIWDKQIPWVETENEKLEVYGLHAGDIVMNRINNAERLGKCGIVLREPEDVCVFGQNTLRIRVKKDIMEPLFLFAWLTHPYTKQYIRENAKNSTSFQSSLNKRVLMELPLPHVDLQQQVCYSQKLNDYFLYIHTAEKIIERLRKLQEIWYAKIRVWLQREEAKQDDRAVPKGYQEGRFWITPWGTTCFYDSYLECIQVPPREIRSIRLSQLPLEAEIQVLDQVRLVSQKNYGLLGHIRVKRIDRSTIQVIQMQPVAYGAEKERDESELLEENGILSEQQDFGYIRHIQEVRFEEDELVESFLTKYSIDMENEYSRFRRLPDSARFFLSQLSAFQQAVFEEFLLALQPLACHMIGKQVALRSGKHEFESRGIQDVIATVRLLEHAGLLERRQGLYLNYDEDYKQGEMRQMILDHRGRPIPIDTWICGDVKG